MNIEPAGGLDRRARVEALNPAEVFAAGLKGLISEIGLVSRFEKFALGQLSRPFYWSGRRAGGEESCARKK